MQTIFTWKKMHFHCLFCFSCDVGFLLRYYPHINSSVIWNDDCMWQFIQKLLNYYLWKNTYFSGNQMYNFSSQLSISKEHSNYLHVHVYILLLKHISYCSKRQWRTTRSKEDRLCILTSYKGKSIYAELL